MRLSLFSFNIFFAAVLTVVLQRSGEDTVIAAKLVQPKEPPTTPMGPEPTMDYVRRAVWGMLYVGEACTILQSPRGLAKMIEIILEVCRPFDSIASAKKTETMSMPPKRTPRTMVRVQAAGQIYEQVQFLTYIGGTVTETPDTSIRGNRQADPRMLDAHQGVPT